MRAKFITSFFVILLGYAVVLFALPYVSVYYTYFAIPALAITGLFGFGSLKNPKLTAAFIFVITLVAWIVTLLTVSYVGVYLTAIALPILGVAALNLLMKNKPISQTIRVHP